MARKGRVNKNDNEKEKRAQISEVNVAIIQPFNSANNKPYKLGVSEFADLTSEEFKDSRNGFKGDKSSTRKTSFKDEDVIAATSTTDCRQKGTVTPIQNQGQCVIDMYRGCCWAFSAVSATVGISQITTGQLLSLSEQELVDCDSNGEDQGCNGGLMDNAFQFIQQNKGITTEANYLYKEASHAAQINGYEDVPTNNEKELLKAVANQPVSVAIDAGGFAFHLLKRCICRRLWDELRPRCYCCWLWSERFWYEVQADENFTGHILRRRVH